MLAADRLMAAPKLYATFLLWLLSELFEDLPEVGDPPKPRLVFFFDEAHLLFEEAPKPLLDKIEQVVRLIRSKGVGVYFISQNPLDIPDDVLGQLGNRVQHALRAFTPRDQRAVRAAAETFRANPKLDVSEAITQLGVGEALVSTLHDKGVPSIVERTLIRPPSSRIGPATAEERRAGHEPQPGGRALRPVDRSGVRLRGPAAPGRAPGGASGRGWEGGRPAALRGRAAGRFGGRQPAAQQRAPEPDRSDDHQRSAQHRHADRPTASARRPRVAEPALEQSCKSLDRSRFFAIGRRGSRWAGSDHVEHERPGSV